MAFARSPSVNPIAGVAFKSLVAQWNGGTTEPVLPTDIPGDLLKGIVDDFGDTIHLPVQMAYESGSNHYKVSAITPPKNSTGMMDTGIVIKSKVPRPPNAWILYRQHNHTAVKAAHPGITNNDISKIIAKMWTAETVESKDKWHAKAIKAKEEHVKKYPGYCYKPRKAGEKKKRMTKRKMALVQSIATNPLSENSFPLTTGPIVNIDAQSPDGHGAITYGVSADNLPVADPQPPIMSYDPKEPMMKKMAFNTETDWNTAISKLGNEMDAYARQFEGMPKHTGPAAWTVEAAPEALDDYNSALDLIPFHDNTFVSDLESVIAGTNVFDQDQNRIVDTQGSISVQAINGPIMASAPANLNPTQTATSLISPALVGGWSTPPTSNPYAAAEVMRQLTLDDLFNFSMITP